jgi:Tol biopolymer transport system component
MSGSSRPSSRQRSKSPHNRRAQARTQARPSSTAPPGAAPLSRGTRPALIAAGALGLAVLVWLALVAFAPGVLPPFLRLGTGAVESPTPFAGTTTPGRETTTAGSSTPDGVRARISFVRTTDGGARRDLYVVNGDGSGQAQLTKDIVIEGTTQWAPDGTRILMQAGIDGISNVAVLEVAEDNRAGTPLSLTSDIGKDSAFPTWSPDGSKIAFQSKMEGDLFQVYVMDADGNNKRRLSTGGGFAGLPAWSPDGSRIAYVSGEQQTAGSQRELFVVPVDGGEPRQLTSLGTSLSNPQWSPTGENISVLQAIADRQYNVLLVNADNGEQRSIVQGGVVRDQRFSPSGNKLAYYNVTPNEGSNVYVLTLEDGTIRNLTEGPGDDYQAAWAPDGSMLAWASKPGNGEYRIVIANPDGTGLRTVSSGVGDDYQPSWGARD